MTHQPCDKWLEPISAYADGEVARRERGMVEEHLGTCAACREWLESVRADREVYAEAYATPERDRAYVREVIEKLRATQEEAKERPRGIRFRLIELFVSGAIVLVLAAALLPCFSRAREKARQAVCSSNLKQIGFARAREKARQTSCLSNVKQLGLGFLMYAEDYGGYLPPAQGWQDTIYPYVKNRDLYKCPLDTSESKCSYAMPWSLSGAKLSDLPDAESQPLVYDATPDGAFAKRHNGGGNVGFADGHAKWMPEAPEGAERGAAIGPSERNYGLAERLHLAYDASVSVETSEVLKALHAAEQIVREQQGFVLDSGYGDTYGQASAQMTFKVPSTRLEITLQALSRLGHMVNRRIHGEDRTQPVVAAETKLRRETTQQKRLGERLARTKRTADRAPIESAIQSSEHQAIAARGELYGEQAQTVLSTVSASFVAPAPHLTPWAAITTAFGRAITWSGRWGGVALAWIAGLAPAWVPVLLVVLLARHLVRRRATASA